MLNQSRKGTGINILFLLILFIFLLTAKDFAQKIKSDIRQKIKDASNAYLEDWKYTCKEIQTGADPGLDDSDWDIAKPRTYRGMYAFFRRDSVCWLRKSIVVPDVLWGEKVTGGKLYLHANVGAKGEIYLDGNLVTRFEVPYGRFQPEGQKVILTEDANPGQKFLIAIKAFSNGRYTWLADAQIEFGTFELSDQIETYIKDYEKADELVQIRSKRLETNLQYATDKLDLKAMSQGDAERFKTSLQESNKELNLIAQKMEAEEAKERRITVKEHIIFDGWKQYSLAVAATLAEAPNGDILCCWMSGSGGEPEADNCVLLARSKDKGKTWSEPIEWIPAGEMASAVGALYTTEDKERMIFIGYYMPAEKHYTEEYFFRMESKDSGYTWSEPERQTLRANNDAVTTHSPIKLMNGEYLFPAQFFEKRPKALVGPVEKLVQATSEKEALAIPAGKGRNPYKFGTHLHGCSVFISKYEDGREMKEFGHIDNRPLGLLEPTAIQLKDGRIVMLMRAEWGGYLWRAESSDNGRTWTDAWETDIPNPTSKPYMIRMDDGRIALIHNATGEKGTFGRRDPMSIWISDDEMETWSIKEDVLRGGSLAYPNAIMLDGRLVFGYDHNRRAARFVEVEFK